MSGDEVRFEDRLVQTKTSEDDAFEELREGYAEKERARQMRRMRRLWAQVLPVDRVIPCRWLVKPEQGGVGIAEVTVGGEVLTWEANGTYMEVEGRPTFVDAFFRKHGGWAADSFKRAVEAFGAWKWHQKRQTPVDERDNYLVEPGYQGPVFQWGEVPVLLKPREQVIPDAVTVARAVAETRKAEVKAERSARMKEMWRKKKEAAGK